MKDFKDIEYLLRSATGYLSTVGCPSCGSTEATLIERKYLLTRLFECTGCRLRFRHPREDGRFLKRFYNTGYEQDDGITTQLPSEEGWQGMVKSGFGEKNIDHYAESLPLLFPESASSDIRMVDYGCSWGYQTHQFRSHGVDCIGFDISASRASFGRRSLGLPILTDPEQIPRDNHIFFNSHVIEHLPSPADFLRFAFDRIRPGGYFVAETPNGSEAFRRKDPAHFSKLWGRVHPNLMSDDFYLNAFKGLPVFMMSYPFVGLKAALAGWDRKGVRTLDLSGPHLLVIVKKTKPLDSPAAT